MATVRARGRKRVFHALWYVHAAPATQDQGGTKSGRKRKLMQKATGTTDRRKAQEIADRWEKEAQRPESEITMEQVRSVMADMWRRAKNAEPDMKMTARDFGERWIRSKKADGLEHSTITFYKSSIKQFCDHLDRAGLGGRQLFEITPAMITDFRDALAEQVSKTTANHHLKALRMFFKAARLEGWNPDDPAERVKTLKVRRADKQKARPFSNEQVQMILPLCNEEWRSVVWIAFYTGKRLIDVATLMESQVDVFKKLIKWVIQKTDTLELSPMHPALHAHLMKREWSDKGDRPMHPKLHALVKKATGTARSSALSKQFEHILIRAGLRCAKTRTLDENSHNAEKRPARRRLRDPYSFHSLRHTLSTNLMKAGVDKRVAMELVGHEDQDVHEGYTHFPLELLSAEIGKLPSLRDE